MSETIECHLAAPEGSVSSCDHGHGAGAHHHHDHAADLKDDPKARPKLLFAGILTGLFMVAEIAGGLLSGSLALLADAGHMLTDTASLWLAWGALVVAQRPSSDANTFGFHRAKIVAAYTNALTLLAVAVWIVFEAVTRLLDPQPILSGTMLIVAIVGLAVNIAVLFVLHGGGDSLNMRGARLHVLGDLLGSIAAVTAALIIWQTGWSVVDPALSVLMAAILGYGATRLLRQALHILLQGVPTNIDMAAVTASLKAAVPGLVDIHHLHLWALDEHRLVLTLHAILEEGAPVEDTVLNVKSHLSEAHAIHHSTVEIEFTRCADQVAAPIG